jgi:hypothetical protein
MEKKDLTKIEPEKSKIKTSELTDLKAPKVRFLDIGPLRGFTKPELKRENTASALAIIIVLTFSILVISSLYLLFFKEGSEKIIDYISIVLPPVTTLIGMVFGFYFSEKRL